MLKQRIAELERQLERQEHVNDTLFKIIDMMHADRRAPADAPSPPVNEDAPPAAASAPAAACGAAGSQPSSCPGRRAAV
jgi:hypothetical protein